MEGEPEVVSLLDEEGRERHFRLHDAFSVDDENYYLVEDTEEPEAVMVLREGPEGLEALDGEELDRVIDRLEADS